MKFAKRAEVSLKLGLLLPPLRVGGSRKNLDLGEGLREILILRYLTKVEKTHQVERVAAADGGAQVR